MYCDAGNLFETISSMYFQLTNSERKVADYILGHRNDAQYMSISDLAEACGVADATISRFCRRLGLGGYNSFKLEVAKASIETGGGTSAEFAQKTGDPHMDLCQKIANEHFSTLEQTIKFLDEGQVQAALDLIDRAGRVVCMGQGSSMVMAQEAWTIFSNVSSKFIWVPDSHLQINTLSVMEPRDVVMFFSYSGSTRDFQDVLAVAKDRQVKVILISRFAKSPGGQLADVVLQCGANESPLQTSSTAARIAQLFVLEVLFRRMVERNPRKAEQYRENIAEAMTKKHL